MRLSFDEKPQMQALARTQAGLPATAGRPATRTHDYVRHGTLSLRAALDLDTGRIYYACAARNRHQEFLAFLRQLARRFPTRQVCIWSWTTTRPTSTARCGTGGRPIPVSTFTSSPPIPPG